VARNTYENWIPEEWGGAVITRVNQTSAVEKLARREPMGSDTKHVPRSAGVDSEVIAKGAPYGEDTSVNDEVLLTAFKFGKAIRIAEEDLLDTARVADIIATKQDDWARSYAKHIDNATLGVSAASNGTTRPYNSVYYALTQNNASTGYTANANLTQTGSGGTTYANLSSSARKVEQGDYFDEADLVVIAHPAFKDKIRNVKDSQLRPIFIQGTAATPDTVFGYPITWSLGAKTSATATPTPGGNPLMVFCNKQYLVLGIRSGPESFTAGANSGVGFLSDEAILKMRARRGFAVGHEAAFAVLEDNSGS
jgi:HK97 family phage major capsid protein